MTRSLGTVVEEGGGGSSRIRSNPYVVTNSAWTGPGGNEEELIVKCPRCCLRSRPWVVPLFHKQSDVFASSAMRLLDRLARRNLVPNHAVRYLYDVTAYCNGAISTQMTRTLTLFTLEFQGPIVVLLCSQV